MCVLPDFESMFYVDAPINYRSSLSLSLSGFVEKSEWSRVTSLRADLLEAETV